MRTRRNGRVTRRGRIIVSNASHRVARRRTKPAMAIKSLIHAPGARYKISGIDCGEQKFLQLGKTVWERNGYLWPIKDCGEPLGHFRTDASGARDGLVKLRRMRGG